MEDDLVALLALDADERGRFPGALDKTLWESLVGGGDALRGQHWLLTYEASRRGWLASGVAEVAGNDFFRALRDHGVRFYDSDREHIPFRGPAAPLPGGLLPDGSL